MIETPMIIATKQVEPPEMLEKFGNLDIRIFPLIKSQGERVDMRYSVSFSGSENCILTGVVEGCGQLNYQLAYNQAVSKIVQVLSSGNLVIVDPTEKIGGIDTVKLAKNLDDAKSLFAAIKGHVAYYGTTSEFLKEWCNQLHYMLRELVEQFPVPPEAEVPA
jgi:hypothetical protein